MNGKEVTEVVSRYYCEDIDNVMSRSRKMEFVKPMHVIFYILNKHFGYSTVDIGKLFDRDHSSVIHGMDKVVDLLDVYEDEMKDLANILGILNFKRTSFMKEICCKLIESGFDFYYKNLGDFESLECKTLGFKVIFEGWRLHFHYNAGDIISRDNNEDSLGRTLESIDQIIKDYRRCTER